VAALVLADGVAVGEAEDVGDALRIDEIVDGDLSGHRPSLQMKAEPSEASASFQS
jgi:hypothetical protein